MNMQERACDERRIRTNIKTKKERGRIYISPLAPLPIICFLLIGNNLYVWASVLAALLHESAHVAAILLLGGRVKRLEIMPFGGELITGEEKIFSYFQSALISSAGIGVNILCAAFVFTDGFGRAFGFCSMGLALFNLMPAKGLDGGDILSDLLLTFLMPETTAKIVRFTSILSVCVLCFIFFLALICSCFNPALPLFALYLLFRALCTE